MESPLSFNSSENFRKKLLVRNLPPYKVENAFSSEEKPGSIEFSVNDLVPTDSLSVEQIGNKQEQILFPINQYGPQNGSNEYGETVSINDNLNYKILHFFHNIYQQVSLFNTDFRTIFSYIKWLVVKISKLFL